VEDPNRGVVAGPLTGTLQGFVGWSNSGVPDATSNEAQTVALPSIVMEYEIEQFTSVPNMPEPWSSFWVVSRSEKFVGAGNSTGDSHHPACR
jgi:hypothetical protein